MNEIVNCVAYANGKRVEQLTLSAVHEVLGDTGKFVWIGLHDTAPEMLATIQQEFGLHDLAVEDAKNAHQRPKIEIYDNTVFIVIRTAHINEARKIEYGETHFFIGDNFIISVRHGPSAGYNGVRQRCESMPHLLSFGQGFALYAVLDFIVDQYFPVIHELNAQLQQLEQRIFKAKPSRETTEYIYQLKRELIEVKQAVSPIVDISNRLMRYELSCINPGCRPYFRDVYDHALRINDVVDNIRELLNTTLEANFSLLSIAQNDVSKRFAGWAAIIALPTMIAGFYGMNFKYIPQHESQNGFYLVIFGTIAACGIMYISFRKSGWL